LNEALRRIRAAGYTIANLDSVLILAQPKIGPHTAGIRRKLSDLLGISADRIGVKAKTPEGMGTDNAAIAHAAVLLEEAKKPTAVRRRTKSVPRKSKK
jgi:2-C-methyl-D-erythritol 2,4-cyclodiphosphate synthase